CRTRTLIYLHPLPFCAGRPWSRRARPPPPVTFRLTVPECARVFDGWPVPRPTVLDPRVRAVRGVRIPTALGSDRPNKERLQVVRLGDRQVHRMVRPLVALLDELNVAARL